MEDIKAIINESIICKTKLMHDEVIIAKLKTCVELLVAGFQSGKKVLFCGNGGSAADAQHLAAELSGRFYIDRKPLAAEALHVNSSYLTAVANDYGYDFVYSRMIEAIGRKGDVLIALSTSGNSSNIIRAVNQAKELGMLTIAFTGQSGGQLRDMVDILINVPSHDTPRIQEAHIMLGHILCQLVEHQLFVD